MKGVQSLLKGLDEAPPEVPWLDGYRSLLQGQLREALSELVKQQEGPQTLGAGVGRRGHGGGLPGPRLLTHPAEGSGCAETSASAAGD